MEGPFLPAFLLSAPSQARLADGKLTRILAQIAAGRPAEHFPNNFDFFLDGRAAVVHAFIRSVGTYCNVHLLQTAMCGVIVSLSNAPLWRGGTC